MVFGLQSRPLALTQIITSLTIIYVCLPVVKLSGQWVFQSEKEHFVNCGLLRLREGVGEEIVNSGAIYIASDSPAQFATGL